MFKIIKMLSALAVAGAYLVSLIPVYLGKVLDGITEGTSNLIQLIIAFASLYLLTEVVNIFRRVSVDRVSAGFEEELRNNSIRKLLRLPIKEFIANGVNGELTSKINQAVSGASQLMKMLPNDLLPAVFTGIFVVIQCIEQIRALGAEDSESIRLSPQTKRIRLTECRHQALV